MSEHVKFLIQLFIYRSTSIEGEREREGHIDLCKHYPKARPTNFS